MKNFLKRFLVYTPSIYALLGVTWLILGLPIANRLGYSFTVVSIVFIIISLAICGLKKIFNFLEINDVKITIDLDSPPAPLPLVIEETYTPPVVRTEIVEAPLDHVLLDVPPELIPKKKSRVKKKGGSLEKLNKKIKGKSNVPRRNKPRKSK